MINGSKKKINVLASESWSQGIIGLVAGRISDETGVSSIAISINGELAKGSARSRNGVNIIEVLRGCSDLLVAVGGHKGAAGFTIETNNIDSFRERLEKLLDGQEILDQELEIEAEVEGNKLSFDLVKKIQAFEPFGIANQKPILVTSNIVLSDLKTVGDGKHLKGKADGVDFIGFGMGRMIDILNNGAIADLAFNLEINRFNGLEKLQLKLVDLKTI
jgi:single-stranded-DNA-specific exonuclease